jgi:hypothetical protein
MKTQYSIERRKDYLYFTIKGEYKRKEIWLLAELLARECQKEKINKILVNALHLAGTNLTTMERYLAGEKIAEIFPAIKLAVAWPEKDIDKFAETVAVNRGGFIQVVPDVETAEKWLLMRI